MIWLTEFSFSWRMYHRFQIQNTWGLPNDAHSATKYVHNFINEMHQMSYFELVLIGNKYCINIYVSVYQLRLGEIVSTCYYMSYCSVTATIIAKVMLNCKNNCIR